MRNILGEQFIKSRRAIGSHDDFPGVILKSDHVRLACEEMSREATERMEKRERRKETSKFLLFPPDRGAVLVKNVGNSINLGTALAELPSNGVYLGQVLMEHNKPTL